MARNFHVQCRKGNCGDDTWYDLREDGRHCPYCGRDYYDGAGGVPIQLTKEELEKNNMKFKNMKKVVIALVAILCMANGMIAQTYPDEIEGSKEKHQLLMSQDTLIRGIDTTYTPNYATLEVRNDSLCLDQGSCFLDLSSLRASMDWQSGVIVDNNILKLGSNISGISTAQFLENRYQYLNGFNYEFGGSVNDASIRPVISIQDPGDVWMGARNSSTANNQSVFFFDRSKGAFNLGRNTNVNLENFGNFSSSIGISNSVTGNSSFASGNSNQATGDFSTAQGQLGTASGLNATVFGGYAGKSLGDFSGTAGDRNEARNNWSGSLFGSENIAEADFAGIFSGREGYNSGLYAVILGGRLGYTNAQESTLGGGVSNRIIAGLPTSSGQGIFSGAGNQIYGTSDNKNSGIFNGENNSIINAFNSVILGGKDIQIGSLTSTLCNYVGVLSGDDIKFLADQAYLSWAGGGRGHRFQGQSAIYSWIGGGLEGVMSGDYSFNLGGIKNSVYGNKAGALGGSELNSYAAGEFTLGTRNTTNPFADQINYSSNSILFSLGNGGDGISNSNAMTVFKNGRTQINTTGYNSSLSYSEVTPNAALEVVSNDSGIRFPNIVNTSAVNTPNTGETIFDLSDDQLKFYNGFNWVNTIQSLSKSNDTIYLSDSESFAIDSDTQLSESEISAFGFLNSDNLVGGFVPYYDGTELENSPMYTNGINMSLGSVNPSTHKFEVFNGGIGVGASHGYTLGQTGETKIGRLVNNGGHVYLEGDGGRSCKIGSVLNGVNTFFDNINNRVGIGTLAPSATLDVVGNAEINGQLKYTTQGGTAVSGVGLDASGNLTTNGVTLSNPTDELDSKWNDIGNLVQTKNGEGVKLGSFFPLIASPHYPYYGYFIERSSSFTGNYARTLGGVIAENATTTNDIITSFGVNGTEDVADFFWIDVSGLNGATNDFILKRGVGLGLGTSNPSARLDVIGNVEISGEMRLGDHIGGNAINVGGYDSNNQLVRVSLGSGLSLSSGTLSASGTSPWTISGSNINYTTGSVSIGTTSAAFDFNLDGSMWINNGVIIDGENSGGSTDMVLTRQGTEMGYRYINPTVSVSGNTVTIGTATGATQSTAQFDIPEPTQHVGRATITNQASDGTTNWTNISLNTVSFETGDVDVNTSLERIIANSSGYYEITYQGLASGGTSIEGQIRIKRDNVSLTEYVDQFSFNNEDEVDLDFTDVVFLSSGQYIGLEMRQLFTGATNDFTIEDLYITVKKL